MIVLCCDLVGTSARAERVDTVDVRAFLAPGHLWLRAEVERLGALFGITVVAVSSVGRRL